VEDIRKGGQPPPLPTVSWLRDNRQRLTQLQQDGELCVYRGQELRTMIPVGLIGTRQLFACMPTCEPTENPTSHE
jgi:hypothetical protein